MVEGGVEVVQRLAILNTPQQIFLLSYVVLRILIFGPLSILLVIQILQATSLDFAEELILTQALELFLLLTLKMQILQFLVYDSAI